jgi:hypothetical protein
MTKWIGKCSNIAIACQNKNGSLAPPDNINEYKEFLAIKLYETFGVKVPELTLSKQPLSFDAQRTYR